jgi:hypothetical protein
VRTDTGEVLFSKIAAMTHLVDDPERMAAFMERMGALVGR